MSRHPGRRSPNADSVGPPCALRGAILALADDPRPSSVRELVDADDLWRIRLRIDGSPWRVVYQVRDPERLVVVTRVARRDEGTYRQL